LKTLTTTARATDIDRDSTRIAAAPRKPSATSRLPHKNLGEERDWPLGDRHSSRTFQL